LARRALVTTEFRSPESSSFQTQHLRLLVPVG